MKPALYLLCAALAGYALSAGCAAPYHESASIEVLFNSNQCQFSAEQTSLINRREELQHLIDLLMDPPAVKSGNTPGMLPTVIGNARPTPAGLPAILTALLESHDFDTGTLVLVARGTQANPGYGITVQDDMARITGSELKLPVHRESPDPNRLYPQMTISPCVLLSVQTSRNIKTVTLGL